MFPDRIRVSPGKLFCSRCKRELDFGGDSGAELSHADQNCEFCTVNWKPIMQKEPNSFERFLARRFREQLVRHAIYHNLTVDYNTLEISIEKEVHLTGVTVGRTFTVALYLKVQIFYPSEGGVSLRSDTLRTQCLITPEMMLDKNRDNIEPERVKRAMGLV